MPTILRIPERLEITEPLVTTIQSLLDSQFTIERYSLESDLLHSYQQRIHSLFEAFDFLCEAILPEDNYREKLTEIKPYLDWCRQHCHFLPGWTAAKYQEQLTSYTTLLVDAVAKLWAIKPKESISLLDKAEQYLLLQKPRPSLATIIKANSDSSNVILIMDKPLAPFTQETIDELKRIKASNPKSPSLSDSSKATSQISLSFLDSENFDELHDEVHTNNWFYYLPAVEKKLLYHTLQHMDLDDPKAVNRLINRLRRVPGLANLAENQTYIINQDTGEIKKSKLGFRSSHLASRDAMEYPASIYELHTKRNIDRLRECANQGDPSTSPPLLIQTLISPIIFNEPDYWLEKQRLAAVAYAKTKQGSVYSTNHPFNYARIAISTPSASPECLEILKAAQDHLNEMQQRGDPEQEQYLHDLNELITEYDKTLNSGHGTAWATDYNGRELFLSYLEDILVSYIGGVSYGSCVSGKDRKAIQLIHTSAMLVFHEQYGHWPMYTEVYPSPDRNNFVQIFTQLYCSHHHQLFSGQNAPGSNGIKNPEAYLPTDIINAIESKNLAQDDRLASNNEVENIVPVTNVSANYPHCLMAANRLSHVNVNSLLKLLTIIVHEENFWASKTTPNVFSTASSYLPKLFAPNYWREPNHNMPDSAVSHIMPDTITMIFNILNIPDKPSEDLTTPFKKLADIYDVILRRDDKKFFRRHTTDHFYKTLEIMINAPDDHYELNQIFDITLRELRALKFKIFEFNTSVSATSAVSPQ